jgi:thermopsin
MLAIILSLMLVLFTPFFFSSNNVVEASVVPTASGVVATFDTAGNASGIVDLNQSVYKPIPINVSGPSYVVYASSSNTSVSTALMSSTQLENFKFTRNIANSIYITNGTQNLNAILLTRGLYFMVMEASQRSANVSYVIKDERVVARNSSTYVGEFVTIPPFSRLQIPVHYATMGSPSSLELFGVSNQTIMYSICNQSNGLEVFASPGPETITNLSYDHGNLSLGYNFTLSQGYYSLTLDNSYEPTAAYAYFEYQIIPKYVNPYLSWIFNQRPPVPTGIAAMGLFNNSGSITTYRVEASSIVGFAKISSMLASDPNFTGDTRATLQLNSMLQVKNNDNVSTFTYWPQNVLLFSTSSSLPDRLVTYRDSILNMTGDGATLSNTTVLGSGYVSGNAISGYYYGNYNSTNVYNYDFPLTLLVYLNETVQKGVGVWIYEGTRALQNGTSAPGQQVWFDKILIVDPNVSSAYFLVSGAKYTPAGPGGALGSQFDSELVFGGDLGGGNALFSSLSAALSLFYYNGSLRTFPSVYPFGTDTAEGAYNLEASYSGQCVSVNTTYALQNYSILTNNYSSSLSSIASPFFPQSKQSEYSLTIYMMILATGTAAVAASAMIFIRRSRPQFRSKIH